MAYRAMPRNFSEFLTEGLDDDSDEKEVVFWGLDRYGRFESEARVLLDYDLVNVFETRRYFHLDGRLRRVARVRNEMLIRTEEWSETGDQHRIISYGDSEEWIYEKVDGRYFQHGILSINRDSPVFSSLPEEDVRALADGKLDARRLPGIRDEGLREMIFEIMGAGKIAPALPLVSVDQSGPNRLLSYYWDSGGEPWYFLELHCTSTGKVSYLRVPPGFYSVLDAIAWTFGMEDKKQYQLEVET